MDAFSASHRRENMVGLSRFELLTPRLSSVCSNQLSYRPVTLSLDPLLQRPTMGANDSLALVKEPRAAQVPSKLDRAHSQTNVFEHQIDH